MRGPRAASTSGTGGTGPGAPHGAGALASREAPIVSIGGPYDPPRVATEGAWLTPIPRMKRPGYASPSVLAPLAIAIGSRAWMLAIPDATAIRCGAASRIAAWPNTSLLPSVSGIHTAG